MPLLSSFRSPRGRVALALAACCAVGAAVAIAVLPAGPTRPDPHEAPPRVRLGGREVPLAREEESKALEAMRAYAAGTLTLVVPGGERRTFSRGQLGAEIDRGRLSLLLAAARDPASELRARARARRAPIDLPAPVGAQPAVALATLTVWKDAVDRAPLDARFDLETKALLPEQAGLWLDVWGTLAQVEQALAEGRDEAVAVVEAKPAHMAAAQMGNVAFADVIGWFETRYATDRKHQARTYNLRLAASKLDGHVILPGESFDFNQVVGPRDEASGYKVAPVIAQGELVDGIGGGTCQIAGTLHGAAFFSGLEVVERHPHTRPSFYIKMGLDATVVYPTITLRLKNPFPFPVVLHETVRAGVVRAEILGPRRARTVSFVRKIDEVVPFSEVERRDPALPRGAKVLAQRGIPGFKIHRYRIVRDGAFAVRERWNDTYPPTPQIVRVGEADPRGAPPVPEDDPHPEYVADDYLALLQGPDVRSPKATEAEAGGGMTETREPGRTGTYGWTEREGLSHVGGGARSAEGDEAGGAPDPPTRRAKPRKGRHSRSKD